MDDAEHSANHTDLSRRIKLGSCLYRTLLDYMTSMNTEYVGLSVPVSDPEWYQPKCAKFVDRFPKEYVDEVEALLAQGGCVLTLNKRKSDDVSLFRVTSEKDFTRVLLSLFVQSVQQRNRHAGMLYAMVNISPSLKNSKRCVFVSETNQCCFRHLTAKIVYKNRAIPPDIRLYVRSHIQHDTLLDLGVITKWFDCERHRPFYTT